MKTKTQSVVDEGAAAIEVAAFKSVFARLTEECHRTSREHGFWDLHDRLLAFSHDYFSEQEIDRLEEEIDLLYDAQRVALFHSKLSETLEALRDGNPPSKKIPEFSQVEEELADVLIRIFDYAGGRGLNLAGAVLAKMAHKEGRPPKHGREF